MDKKNLEKKPRVTTFFQNKLQKILLDTNNNISAWISSDQLGLAPINTDQLGSARISSDQLGLARISSDQLESACFSSALLFSDL